MQMPRPTDADRQRFHDLLPDDPRVEVKPMFGNLGAFVNGNMFMALLGADVGLKLPPDDLAALRAEEGVRPWGPGEKPLAEYATLPADWDAEAAAAWTSRALALAASLPPKVKKK
jgi:TfoX/Sxy family transcriptional regulator of competence genes